MKFRSIKLQNPKKKKKKNFLKRGVIATGHFFFFNLEAFEIDSQVRLRK